MGGCVGVDVVVEGQVEVGVFVECKGYVSVEVDCVVEFYVIWVDCVGVVVDIIEIMWE